MSRYLSLAPEGKVPFVVDTEEREIEGYYLTAAAAAEAARLLNSQKPPEVVETTDEDDRPVLACPHDGCDSTEFLELDRAERENPVEYLPAEPEASLLAGISVAQGQSDFETVGWLCAGCRRDVSIPLDLDVSWS